MISFDDLVLATHAELSQRHRKRPVSHDDVHSILTAANLQEVMQVTSTPRRRRCLLVRQIVVKGRKWSQEDPGGTPFTYQRQLHPGVNTWIAGNSTGKSSILRVIGWALTGVKPNLKPDVESWLEEILVEVELSDLGVYTIAFQCRMEHPNVMGGIFAADIESIKADQGGAPIKDFNDLTTMRKAIGEFFSAHLGFVALEAARWKSYDFSLAEAKITWDTYSQVVTIPADTYEDYLFPDGAQQSKHHAKTMGMYLGLDLQEAIARAQLARDRARSEYAFEERRIRANAAGVTQRITKLRADLQYVTEQLAALEAEDAVAVDPTFAAEVHQRVVRGLRHLRALEDAERDLVEEERQCRNEVSELRRTCQQLSEAIEFGVFLNGMRIEKCPHCETAIPTERMTMEITSGLCGICGSGLTKSSATQMQQALLDIEKDKLGKQRRALSRIEKEVNDVHRQIDLARTENLRYDREYQDIQRQAAAGYKAEKERLLVERGNIEGQLVWLSTQTEEQQQDRLVRLRLQQDILNATLSKLSDEVAQRYGSTLYDLRRTVNSIASSLDIRNFEAVELDERFEMSVRQSGRLVQFSRMDPGERLRLKLAFHLALLSLAVEREVGHHPGLLVIDAPASSEMDDPHFSAIVKRLGEIGQSLGDRVQILIASARDDLAEICSEDRIERKRAGEVLF